MKLLEFMAKKKPLDSVIVADLDSILSKNISFKLHDKTFTFVPMSVEQWLIAVSSETKLRGLQLVENLNVDTLVEAYHEFISQMCPEITKDDIKNCTQQQVASLWQLALDVMNGYSEKKTLLTWKLMGMSRVELTKLKSILDQLLSMPDDLLQKFQEKQGGQ